MFGKMGRRLLSAFVVVVLAVTASGEDLQKLLQAAKDGNANAQYIVASASLYEYMKGGRKKKDLADLALAMYSRAAKQDHADALYALGMLGMKGLSGARVIKQNPAAAAVLLRRAAEKGHAGAQYEIGACLFSGNGVEQDRAAAIAWWRKAAAQENAEAKKMLEKTGQTSSASTRTDKDGVLFSADGRVLKRAPKNLTYYRIPKGVKTIELNAFRDCTELAVISIPDSVEEIKYGAFHGCTSLRSVAIPDSVTEIEEHAFSDCTSLSSITMNFVCEIKSWAFANCTSLTSITFPDCLVTIYPYAFRDCTSLSKVTFASGGTRITSKSFMNTACEEQMKRDHPLVYDSSAF